MRVDQYYLLTMYWVKSILSLFTNAVVELPTSYKIQKIGVCDHRTIVLVDIQINPGGSLDLSPSNGSYPTQRWDHTLRIDRTSTRERAWVRVRQDQDRAPSLSNRLLLPPTLADNSNIGDRMYGIRGHSDRRHCSRQSCNIDSWC